MDCCVAALLAMTGNGATTDLAVIASRARQSMTTELRGLPRHYVPRNDDAGPFVAQVAVARLPNPRWHRRARLHPCGGPGAGAPEGAGTLAGSRRVPGH